MGLERSLLLYLRLEGSLQQKKMGEIMKMKRVCPFDVMLERTKIVFESLGWTVTEKKGEV